TPPSQ
ncbi:hypothetical protein D030_3765B, partial [Vibrio parahaemolyticus AQ3810]